MFSLVFMFAAVCAAIYVISTIKANPTAGKAGDTPQFDAPLLNVPAVLVNLREEYHPGSGHYTFHALFEVESGDRLEFTVPEESYRTMTPGSEGMVYFRDRLFLEFRPANK